MLLFDKELTIWTKREVESSVPNREIAGNQSFLPFQGQESTKSYWLTLSQTNQVYMCLQYKSFENTVGKGEIAHIEQFLLFPQCFLPAWRTFCRFNQI